MPLAFCPVYTMDCLFIVLRFCLFISVFPEQAVCLSLRWQRVKDDGQGHERLGFHGDTIWRLTQFACTLTQCDPTRAASLDINDAYIIASDSVWKIYTCSFCAKDLVSTEMRLARYESCSLYIYIYSLLDENSVTAMANVLGVWFIVNNTCTAFIVKTLRA